MRGSSLAVRTSPRLKGRRPRTFPCPGRWSRRCRGSICGSSSQSASPAFFRSRRRSRGLSPKARLFRNMENFFVASSPIVLQRLEMMSGNRVPFLGIRGPGVLLRLHSEHLAVEGEAVVKIADSPALVDEVLPVRSGVPDVSPLPVRLHEPEQAFVVDLPLQFDFLQEGAK